VRLEVTENRKGTLELSNNKVCAKEGCRPWLKAPSGDALKLDGDTIGTGEGSSPLH